MKDKNGVDDFLFSGGTIGELELLPSEVPEGMPRKNVDFVSMMIAEMAKDAVELWRDFAGEGYATIPQDDGMRNVNVESLAFKTYLNRLYFRSTGRGPRAATIGDAVATISAIAKFDPSSKQYETALRWFHQVNSDKPTIWIDLCDGDSVLKIEPMSNDHYVKSAVVKMEYAPVRFLRPNSMRSLPKPTFVGDHLEISNFINVSPEDVDLLWGFIVGCFTPYGGLPLLMMTAQQGSGKSIACKFIRSLVDPSVATSRTVSNLDDVRSVVAANAMFVLDNQSHISQEMSNLFCQLSTGGGYNKKKLYTDCEESLVSGKRPIIFNGLSDISQKPDLLSRCISIELPMLTGKMKSEEDLEKGWVEARPRIFGELVTRLSRALRDLSSIKLEEMPRLADMVRWVTASEPEPTRGQFLAAFSESSTQTSLRIVDEDLVAAAIVKLEQSGLPPKISISELLQKFELLYGSRLPRGFPDNVYKLGRKLKELSPVMQKLGWKMEKSRTGSGRFYEIASPETLNQTKTSDLSDTCMTMQPDLNVT